MDEIWSDRWARNYRRAIQLPPFNPEVTDYSTWDFGHSLGPTQDLTYRLLDAAADAPWARIPNFPLLAQGAADAMGGESARTPNFAVLAQDAADAASFELWQLEHPLLGTGGRVPGPAVPMGGESARTPNFAVLAQDAADAASFELWQLEHPLLGTGGRVPGPAVPMGGESARTPNFAVLAQDAADAASFELWQLEHPLLGTGGRVPGPAVPMGGESARTPNFAVLAQDAADAASFELWQLEHPLLGTGGRVPVSAEDMGNELEHTANSALRMQDAVGGASFELWELEHPLLRIRDGALGLTDAMGSGYGGDGVTGAMDNAGFAADGLALSTGTAEQALLAAGLTGDSTTQVLDLMRRAGLDPATSAWGELATAVHVWGDATDIEVDRVIGRLGELARVQGGGGPGSGGSGGGGGADDRTQRGLDQLMSLAYGVAEERARMGGKPQDFVDHELGKVLGQLGAPDSVAKKLALLRLFFAGSAHGISFGLGPSANSLGFDIPQFAGGGTVPGPLGAPQLIVAHGGEHIVPHRATGSPTIIRIELDREVLSQAVLGDLLRLQGREVTLGLS